VESRQINAEVLRELIDHVLAELDADERRGALLRAAGVHLRIEVTDLDLVVRVDSASDARHHLAWGFADEDERTGKELRLAMDAASANAFLQGKESLPVAIARGRVKCSGDVKSALVCLPALRLLVEPYKVWVKRLHPDLAVA
jgi:hypothetical protein